MTEPAPIDVFAGVLSGKDPALAEAFRGAMDATLEAFTEPAKARRPSSHEFPKELEVPPAGTIRYGEPIDDYCTVEDLGHALGCNSGTLWRWIHQMGKLPYWKVEGTRAHHVRKADAEAWIAELDGLSKLERKASFTITKAMRKARIAELERSRPGPEAQVHQHPVAEQLGFDIPEHSEPPRPRAAMVDEMAMFRSLPWIQAVYGVPFNVTLAAIKAGDLKANKFGPNYFVRHRDLLDWFRRTEFTP